jgi:iron-sulfur cluster assembly protein
MSCPRLGKSRLILSLPLIVSPVLGGWGSGKASRALKESMTTEVANPVVPKIHVSERAAKKIITLLAKDGVSPEQGGLRVGVQGGGCSGLSYAMRLDTQARDRDRIFEEFGARIFVDAKSLLFLNGTTLDYEETLMRQGFVFVNPNAARSCGCGSSFTA